MNKFILVMLLLIAFQYRSEIQTFINPPPNYAAAHNVPVVLYATSWCGYCAKARQFLNDQKIPYYEYDIEKSAEGHAQYKQLGGKGVPVLSVKGKTVTGFNPDLILKILKET